MFLQVITIHNIKTACALINISLQQLTEDLAGNQPEHTECLCLTVSLLYALGVSTVWQVGRGKIVGFTNKFDLTQTHRIVRP